MSSFPDHYAALGIDPTADQEVITAAYRALAKKFHPDTGATTGTANPTRFDEVQRAYEVLRTPESRRQYDVELLAAAEQELEQHLAAKRRAVTYAGDVEQYVDDDRPLAGDARPRPRPKADLGRIRPEPLTRPESAAAAPKRKVPPRKRGPVGPFLVPVILLFAIIGGAAWLFLPKSPDAPPLPASAKTDAAPAKVAAAKPESAPAPAPAPAPEQPPLFGSTATDQTALASAAPATAPESAPPATKPVFGSSLDDAPAAAAEPEAPAAGNAAPQPPLPKPRPAAAARQASQPAAAPAPAPEAAPAPRRGGDGPYRLVIFTRQPGQTPSAWSAGVVFDTEGSCTRFGVKAVLRRKANPDPDMADAKVWYECQLASAQ